MSTVVDEAIQVATSLPRWLQLSLNEDGTRNYPWSKEEESVLRRWWGRVPRPELAERVSQVLQQQTGDPGAVRTIQACACHADDLGLAAYQGEEDEMYLAWAAQVSGVAYHVVHKAARRGGLPTQRRGKKRYVAAGDWEIWLAARRQRERAQDQVLASIDEETISKREAMVEIGVSETQICRYLETGVIRCWKLPDASGGERGTWLVSRSSVTEFVQMRAQGRLGELLDSVPEYVAMREALTQEIRTLRRQGKVRQRDPLMEPKSRYHPGCFTVTQVASHVGLPAGALYHAIKAGRLQAVVLVKGGRRRYAIQPLEARRFADQIDREGMGDWRNRQRRQIAEAGLLMVRDLAQRWDLPEHQVLRFKREGRLTGRRWGRYWVFEPEDVKAFEEKNR